jgi:hypothetical protein
MPRGLRIRKIAQAQIIFVFVDNQSSSQEILRFDMGDQITIRDPCFFNISQISCMTGAL